VIRKPKGMDDWTFGYHQQYYSWAKGRFSHSYFRHGLHMNMVRWVEIDTDRTYNPEDLVKWLKANLKEEQNPYDLLYEFFPNLNGANAKDAVKFLDR